jgi:hypothetical protein
MTAERPDPRPAYREEADALKRVETLKKSGIWPAVIHRDNTWQLTFDPEVYR